MKRPKKSDVKYWQGNFLQRTFDYDLKSYIDQIEAENNKLKQASAILNSLSEEKPCPVCNNKMDYKPRIYHCNHCGSDFN